MALTRRQREVLDVIRQLIEKNGYSPSLEEIGAELGLSSVATVHKHVSHLVQKGYVRRTWNQNRSIELVDSRERQGAVRLPVTGSIGGDAAAVTEATGQLAAVPAELIQDPSKAFLLRVEGDAFGHERMRHDDLLIVEARETVGNGESVIVVLEDGRQRIARCFHEGSGLRFELDRSDVRPLERDAGSMEIRGVLVGLLRWF
jgi:repressor LexA